MGVKFGQENKLWLFVTIYRLQSGLNELESRNTVSQSHDLTEMFAGNGIFLHKKKIFLCYN